MELAQVREIVSDATIGRMRLLWWKEAIRNTFQGRPPQHPVALALAFSLDKCSLSQSFFLRMINARVHLLFFLFYVHK